VLLLVDVLNEVDFPGNSQLLKSIHSLGKNISALKKRCKDAVIPVIYVDGMYVFLPIVSRRP
jgi:isochorismate hydrolase